jgi:type III restriction enzyme
MIELKPFQETAVSTLVKQLRTLLTSPGENKKCVFKSPTGSGKTIMMAEVLQRLSNESWADNLVFVWTSLYDLHNQSRLKLQSYLGDSAYSFLGLEDMSDDALVPNSLLFVNWHSLTTKKNNPDLEEKEWANIFVKQREDGRSIPNVLEKSREEGLEVVLIVDEAHTHYLTENSQKFIAEVFKPKLTIEVSATPLLKIDPEDMNSKRAGFVSVPFGDAVSSGLIKQETVINADVGSFVDVASSADELVISAAVEKRHELQNIYSEEEIQVNPLVLIQLPSDSEKTSALDLSVREEVEQVLASKGITYENGKLAVWLSEEKKNLELIERNDSEVEVLIFKEAVAVGWDCPRAQVLVMLRAIRSLTFEIQTVGRILRMPEAKHYSVSQLNKAFVFTNIAGININDKPEDLDFFKTKFSKKRALAEGVSLKSFYLHRQDYGDLTATFSNILVEELNSRFGIDDGDMANQAFEKADVELELYPDELTMPILSDLVVQNIDSIRSEIGELDLQHIQANVSDSNIQKEFDYLLKAWSLPYAPVRSFTKIKTGLYKWFALIGYESGKWNEVQRIVACSTTNQRVFAEAINAAKEKYELQKPLETAGRKNVSESSYEPPQVLMVGDKHEKVSFTKYGYEPCYLFASRSEPEKRLEKMLDESDKVVWWIKNGEGQQQFFSIVYDFVDAESGLSRKANFFPDFIVKFSDGSTGLYETKSGMLLTDYLTHAKSDALQSYLKSNSASNLKGGIVNASSTGLSLFTKTKYTPEKSEWDALVF